MTVVLVTGWAAILVIAFGVLLVDSALIFRWLIIVPVPRAIFLVGCLERGVSLPASGEIVWTVVRDRRGRDVGRRYQNCFRRFGPWLVSWPARHTKVQGASKPAFGLG